jgi:hypothetical protein
MRALVAAKERDSRIIAVCTPRLAMRFTLFRATHLMPTAVNCWELLSHCQLNTSRVGCSSFSEDAQGSIGNSLPMVFLNDSGITVSFQVETALFRVSFPMPIPALVYAAVSLNETLQKQRRADRAVRVGEA